MAALRCWALHRPTFAARLRDCIRALLHTVSYAVRRSVFVQCKIAQVGLTELSEERVLRTAVTLADRHGIDWLSMRKLADELGVSAMSPYYYVPNKERLIDGMVDIVFSEIEPPSLDDDWKTAMRRRAVSTREALN